MIYTELTKKALVLCFEAHKNQVDKSGMPYVFHPFHVADRMPDEATTIVALLHDVVEDTPYSLEDIQKLGFPKVVTDTLALMTHDKSVPYLDYIKALADNPVARLVKMADLDHNMDLTRLNTVDEEAQARIKKYKMAKSILLEKQIEANKKYAPLQIKATRKHLLELWAQLDERGRDRTVAAAEISLRGQKEFPECSHKA